MNNYRVGKVARCGAMDSKYFSNPQQFDRDMQQHKYEVEQFKSEIKALVLYNPSKVRERYN